MQPRKDMQALHLSLQIWGLGKWSRGTVTRSRFAAPPARDSGKHRLVHAPQRLGVAKLLEGGINNAFPSALLFLLPPKPEKFHVSLTNALPVPCGNTGCFIKALDPRSYSVIFFLFLYLVFKNSRLPPRICLNLLRWQNTACTLSTQTCQFMNPWGG